ncbi:cytochrome C [Myxococcota bacterium]|nr:cytochrome C [Myxococcota bacterium]
MSTEVVHSDHPIDRPADLKVGTAKLRIRAKEGDEALSDKIHSWPYFVRVEFIAGLLLLLGLTVWSLAVDAPLEEPAQPSVTPNPSKAPWYFLGLQEMLVYFDPWLAGVVLPSLIIVGLMVIPYVDVNPKGNGYYTYAERKFAIWTFFFGFHVLWVVQIIIGVFLRGPGWNFFAPWDFWDPHKVVALNNVDWPYLLGARGYWTSFIIGAVTVGGFFSVIPLGWVLYKNKPVMRQLGIVRYLIVAGLFQTMMLLPLKMILRWTLDIKYLWVTPWFNV